jgi:hypothetical protein
MNNFSLERGWGLSVSYASNGFETLLFIVKPITSLFTLLSKGE